MTEIPKSCPLLCLDEGKQNVEFFLDRCDDIHLFQISRCRKLRLIVNRNSDCSTRVEPDPLPFLSASRRREASVVEVEVA